jgi:Copper type II ascorbate-dependent monooxygenase, C-terminal domain
LKKPVALGGGFFIFVSFSIKPCLSELGQGVYFFGFMNNRFATLFSVFVFGLSLISDGELFSQQKKSAPTFADDIAPIIHQNCTPCHRPGEAAPFSLISYEDVSQRGKFIQKVTQIGYMPPWKAAHGFGDFKNERRLDTSQIGQLRRWVAAGMPKGDLRKVTEPVFRVGSQLPQKPDIMVTLPPFSIPTNNQEGFYFFSVPLDLPQDKLVQAIEFRPGNKQLVHHSRVSVDTTRRMRVLSGKSIDDPSIQHLAGIRMMEEFWYGWVPGNNPFWFPPATAKFLPQGSDLLLNIHYSPNSLPATDASTVNLFFAKDNIQREVKTFILSESAISNLPFVIQPNQTKTFYARSEPLPYDISVISVEPHLHKLGKKIRAFAITPDGDLVPFIQIDDWDFNFQETYQFKKMQRVPKGSIIMAEATYDNTAQNPQNPSSPPKQVRYGWNTTSEMMDVIFHFVFYQPGDEKMSW